MSQSKNGRLSGFWYTAIGVRLGVIRYLEIDGTIYTCSESAYHTAEELGVGAEVKFKFYERAKYEPRIMSLQKV